jgi:glycosyltransferase involved in cell wall biosynthesis
MSPVRVGLVCDFREEGWLSMDLIADMLMENLPTVAGGDVVVTRLCPPMVRRWTRLPLVGGAARAHLGDRLTGRFWDYPRWLELRVNEFDVFHIVDHSYAHLVRVLPPNRTIVTCNDIDAIHAAMPGKAPLLNPSRLLASRVLDGLSRASHVACISHATRRALLATSRIAPERVSVVHLGVHPSCSARPHRQSDEEIDKRLGPRRGIELLHVGSTIPRKRIDVLLEVFKGVRAVTDEIRLVRVGGPLTPSQRSLADRLGVAESILEMPFLERPLLAALYRRATLAVLPSDGEGFGLPVVEAMACGSPVVVSDVPALREVGGSAAMYCPPGDVRRWVESLTWLVRSRQADPDGWEARRQACISAAARFDWKAHALEMTSLYLRPAEVRSRAS